LSIILIRHGETASNAARVLQFPDTPLSERGLAQAQAVAKRFTNAKPVAILASDMSRAWMTAEAISAVTGLSIRSSQLLHERNFGDLRGRRFDDLDHNPIAAEHGAPNGESMTVFRGRVIQAFEEMVKMRAGLSGDLVVVSHGLVIKLILAELVQLKDGLQAPEHLGNTSVSVIGAKAPYLAELVDCTTHLSDGISHNKNTVAGV
jgi:broad specificity phosphatase PhoE